MNSLPTRSHQLTLSRYVEPCSASTGDLRFVLLYCREHPWGGTRQYAPGMPASTELYTYLGDCYMIMLKYLRTTV